MITLLLIIIAILLLLIFLSMGRRDMERFFEKNHLPDGKKVNLFTWSGRAIVAGAAVFIVAFLVTKDNFEAIVWAVIIMLMIAWGGPYIQYALAWNFLKDKDKK